MSGQSAAAHGDESAVLKLLASLQPLEISANEAGVVSRIARFAQSERVLDTVARTPKWYARWEIREALLQNGRTPERIRDPIGTGIAIIDLMREMDSRRLTDAERVEIREDIRSLLKSLPPVDHEVIKAHARSLAAAPRLQAEEVPSPELSAAARVEEDLAVHRAGKASSPDDLLGLLGDPRERVRRAAMENQALSEPLLLEAIRLTSEPELLTEVATHPRWAFLDLVRRVVLDHPLVPSATHALLDRTARVLLGFMRYFNEPMEPEEKAHFGKELLADLNELPGPEKEFVKFKIGGHWGPFLREVMKSIEDEFRKVQPRPVATAWSVPLGRGAETVEPMAPRAAEHATAGAATPLATRMPDAGPSSPPEPVAAEAPGASYDSERHVVTPLHQRPPSTEVSRHLAALPLEERIEIARLSANHDEVAFLFHDLDDRVFAAVLDNPRLSEEEIVGIARNCSRDRVRRLVECKRSWTLQGVKIAFLHNPHAPESVQVECLNHVSSVRELALVMRDPKVRSLEVKSKARARIVERWRSMSSDERVSAIKQSGGELLHDLWNEAFNDERMLLRLVQERSLDEGIVLKIVRSRIAPREVLAAIGRDPGWANNYQVRLELTLNPKTPREIVAKLVPKLAPADRQRLRAAGGASEYVRGMA